jgi:hypothetical protein
MTETLLAALAAVLYGAGAAVEHWQAPRTQARSAGRLLGLLARQPLWLAGGRLNGQATCRAARVASYSLKRQVRGEKPRPQRPFILDLG